MQPALSHQRAADVERGLKPFVQIESKAIRPFDSGNEMALVRGNRNQRTDAAIDMQPQPFLGTPIGNGGQIVDGPGIGGSRRRNHAGWPFAIIPIGPDPIFQRDQIHAESII